MFRLSEKPADSSAHLLDVHKECLQNYKSTSYDAITWYMNLWLDDDAANGVKGGCPALDYYQPQKLDAILDGEVGEHPRPAADVHAEWKDPGDWFVGSRLPDDVTPDMLLATARYG